MTDKERKEERRAYARSGGISTREKHDKEYYSRIAKIGRESVRKNDPDFYKRLAAAGLHAREVKQQARLAKEVGAIGNNSVLATFTRFLSGK